MSGSSDLRVVLLSRHAAQCRASNRLAHQGIEEKNHQLNQVSDGRGRRIRGLLTRNDTSYAQIRTKDWVGQVPLHGAEPVPQALSERQALKIRIESGSFQPPSKKTNFEPKVQPQTHSLAEAIERYQSDRDTLQNKDSKTVARENGGLAKWKSKSGLALVAPETFDGKFIKDFALWRKRQAATLGRKLSGRSIDINVTALKHVVKWCVTERWLPEFPPLWHWKAMAEAPEEKILLTTQQVDEICTAALSITEPGLLKDAPSEGLKSYVARLKQVRQSFSDYLKLLALCGGREQEVIHQRWSNIDWHRNAMHFVGGRTGASKRGGGSRESAKPRDVDFHAKLKAHLLEMNERRDPRSGWMFPSENHDSHVKSFRKQLNRVREMLGMPQLGFHLFRHYFISQAVMAGIDIKTIARWVGHRDEGILILKVYGHLAPGHGLEAAKKLDGVWR